MNYRQLIRQDWITIVLLCVYAIDVSYNIQSWPSFQVWLSTLPFLGSSASIIYMLALLCIALMSFLLITGRTVAGWYIQLWLQVIFVSYLCVALLTTDDFFLPYHSWWNGMRWWDRMLISLSMAWLSWLAIHLQKKRNRRAAAIPH